MVVGINLVAVRGMKSLSTGINGPVNNEPTTFLMSREGGDRWFH
jgi:hypothetical protein